MKPRGADVCSAARVLARRLLRSRWRGLSPRSRRVVRRWPVLDLGGARSRARRGGDPTDVTAPQALPASGLSSPPQLVVPPPSLSSSPPSLSSPWTPGPAVRCRRALPAAGHRSVIDTASTSARFGWSFTESKKIGSAVNRMPAGRGLSGGNPGFSLVGLNTALIRTNPKHVGDFAWFRGVASGETQGLPACETGDPGGGPRMSGRSGSVGRVSAGELGCRNARRYRIGPRRGVCCGRVFGAVREVGVVGRGTGSTRRTRIGRLSDTGRSPADAKPRTDDTKRKGISRWH